jgi:hypothetical protein
MPNEGASRLGLLVDRDNKVLLVTLAGVFMLAASPTATFVPLRLHGSHHGDVGDDTEVVTMRQAAYRALNLTDPKFEPFDLS